MRGFLLSLLIILGSTRPSLADQSNETQPAEPTPARRSRESKQAVANRLAGSAGLAVGALAGIGVGVSYFKRNEDLGRYTAVTTAGVGGAALGSALGYTFTSKDCRACRVTAVSAGAAAGALLGGLGGYAATREPGWSRPAVAGAGAVALVTGAITALVTLVRELP